MPTGPPPPRPSPPRPRPAPRGGHRLRGRIAAAAGALALLSCCGGGSAWILTRDAVILRVGIPLLVLASLALWLTTPDRWRALRRRLGLAPGVDDLARRLGVTPAALRACVPSYRRVAIPKRSGGHRVLHVPDPRLKDLQRRILRRLLARIPSHAAAYGFERGRSIAHNAAQHTGRAIVLRFDVVDFFPTTGAGRIERMFLRLGWDLEATALLVRLVTHEGGLPQGAPTSPRLSNLVNRGLDADLTSWIAALHGRYTRYADDITISFPEDWIGTPERALAIVRKAFSRRGYRLHGKEKSSVRRRHQRQVVTGLVVNRHVALPRATRRLLRAARHRAATGGQATLTAEQLRGWEAFEAMVRTQGAETPPPWSGMRPSRNPRRRP